MVLRGNYMNRNGSASPRRGGDHLHGSDLGLLRRAASGDERAFHELVDRHSAWLFRLAFLLVGNEADAEDVVQETLLGAFRHLRRFRGDASVKTWLTRILTRQAAMRHRSGSRSRTVALQEAAGDAGAQAERAGLRLDVRDVLAALAPEHKEVVVLREFEGMSYAEIAEALDVPRGTVESRLFRARQHLKEMLKGYRS